MPNLEMLQLPPDQTTFVSTIVKKTVEVFAHCVAPTIPALGPACSEKQSRNPESRKYRPRNVSIRKESRLGAELKLADAACSSNPISSRSHAGGGKKFASFGNNLTSLLYVLLALLSGRLNESRGR